MLRNLAALSLALTAGILAACGGRSMGPGSGGAMSYALPPMEDLAINATLPKHAIGEDFPTVLGTIKIRSGMVGGFTQSHWSQQLGFPPGTKITIHNLSKSTTHTFNVVKEILKPTAHFPSNPTLSTSASGGDKLEVGYASGPIKPGGSVTVVLAKAGVYMVGCAFHYQSNGMRDILVVKAGAKPGPQATSPSGGGGGGATPTPPPGGGGWDPVH